MLRLADHALQVEYFGDGRQIICVVAGGNNVVVRYQVRHQALAIGHAHDSTIEAVRILELGVFWKLPLDNGPAVERWHQLDQGDFPFSQTGINRGRVVIDDCQNLRAESPFRGEGSWQDPEVATGRRIRRSAAWITR